MPALVIVGAQWGDEGKGKVVDLLAESADVVVRYAGGPNAGHTLVVGDEKLVFRLVPSGVLHKHTECLLGQGMVINPAVLLQEIETLSARGLEIEGRLRVSEMAHLILPYHIQLDELRENAKEGTKIGTTKRGIGPCYEDKTGRRGVRVRDLRNSELLRARVSEALRTWAPTFEALGSSAPALDDICGPLLEQGQKLLPYCTDTSMRLEELTRAGKRVMLEGAQGTMLDIDHGTYPFVTSSSAVAGGACIGAGIGPSRITRVLGITKAYTTRVGAGPFPTELDDAIGQRLRDAGGEYGSVTGRPRRTGWLDIAALRYTRRVNGLDGLAVTKLDVLSGLAEVKTCVGYETSRGRIDSMPVGELETIGDVQAATPIYETHAGWSEDITKCRRFEDLPATAQRYLRCIEEQTELPIYLVSVGPRRDETIVLQDAMA